MIGSWVRVVGSIHFSEFFSTNSSTSSSSFFSSSLFDIHYPFFFILFIGQTLCACCQAFIFSAPNVIAAEWFPDSERTLTVAIGNVFNQGGAAIGFILSPIIVKQSNYHSTFVLLSIIQSIIATMSGAAAIMWFENRPPTPPSPSAQLNKQARSKMEFNWQTFKQQLVTALLPFKSLNFWLLMHGIGVSQGIYGAILTLLDAIGEPRGFNTTDAGNFGFAAILGSLPMLLFAGWFIDKTK